MNYWLLKSEPSTYSIHHLSCEPQHTTFWEGVRNYQARNFLRDAIKKNDLLFFYHSNCKDPGIVGIANVVKAGYPDPTQFDPTSQYCDPHSHPANPRWYGVEVKLVTIFQETITLSRLKRLPTLKEMWILRKGNRLSVTPVTTRQWKAIVKLANSDIV